MIALVAAGGVLTGSLFLLHASRAETHAQACPPEITDITGGPRYRNYDHGPGWSDVGSFPVRLSVPRAVSTTNRYHTTVPMDARAVSAALGFPVGTRETPSGAATIDPADDGLLWRLEAGTVDRTVTFDVRDGCSHAVIGDGYATRTGNVTVRTALLEPDGSTRPGHDSQPN